MGPTLMWWKKSEEELSRGGGGETQFRRLAVQLHHDLGLETNSRSVLLVTPSARNEESCSNGGLALAKCLGDDLGRPVLLVDLSSANTVLSRRLDCEQRPGFIDGLLQEPLKLDDLVLATSSERVFFLPAGQGEGRVPLEVLPRFLESALHDFGFLVLFGGSVFDNPTALAIAPHVGMVLLFAEDNQTLLREIELATETLNTCTARRVGMVLTTDSKP